MKKGPQACTHAWEEFNLIWIGKVVTLHDEGAIAIEHYIGATWQYYLSSQEVLGFLPQVRA